MMRIAMIAALFALLPLSAAVAQDMTSEQRAACKGDYDKFCKGTMPGGGRIIACLNKQHDSLAEACKNVVDGQKK